MNKLSSTVTLIERLFKVIFNPLLNTFYTTQFLGSFGNIYWLINSFPSCDLYYYFFKCQESKNGKTLETHLMFDLIQT